ncbi:MAG: hypothetical protein HQ595_00510 [Candidatus Omnitrophica bacterium]|nr:hypothetical protein [Candidatus Omnitrophota bacterium]
MSKTSAGRISAMLFFLLLIVGAGFCIQRLTEDVALGKYFTHLSDFRYEMVFLISYILIIIFLLRYGFYLAVNTVNWEIVKNDFLYLLNKKHFSKTQWILNLLLFWSALAGFIYSLAISTMQGSL